METRPVVEVGGQAVVDGHPRCGTRFLLAIGAVATVAHPLLPADPWPLRVGARVAGVPVVAAETRG